MKEYQIIKMIGTKNLIAVLGLCALLFMFNSASSQVTNVVNSLTDTKGNLHSIQNLKGQKVLVVILPSTHTYKDTALIERIDSIAKAQIGLVRVIVVPSYEDGYYTDANYTLINWYQTSFSSSVIVSRPLYTHIKSGQQQDPLFKWLTHSSLNSHFDTDVSGAGMMFLIDSQSNLIGTFDPEAIWNKQYLNLILQ